MTMVSAWAGRLRAAVPRAALPAVMFLTLAPLPDMLPGAGVVPPARAEVPEEAAAHSAAQPVAVAPPDAVKAEPDAPSSGESSGGTSVGGTSSERVGTVPAPEIAQSGPAEVAELWTGSLYTSSYRVGVCFSAEGKVRGVVHLRLRNGQVDVYHIYGSVRDNKIEARHASGHTFKGKLVSPDTVEGVISLKNGMKVSLEGKRIHGVSLAPENCAPLSR